jgi:hypothetical protein
MFLRNAEFAPLLHAVATQNIVLLIKCVFLLESSGSLFDTWQLALSFPLLATFGDT